MKVLRHHRPYLTQINYETNEWNVIRFCLEQQFSTYLVVEFARLVTQQHSALISEKSAIYENRTHDDKAKNQRFLILENLKTTLIKMIF